MGILTQRLMDSLLFLLPLLPVAGGAMASLAGVPNTFRNRFLRSSGFLSALLCIGIMGLVVYRRFYLPLGAQQLEIHWVDWFSVPPLTVPFALRMDSPAGVLCVIVVLFGALFQLFNLLPRSGAGRPRGTFSVMMGAILLFILADNLVLVAAALVLTGPLIAIAGFRHGVQAPERDRILQFLVIHGIGDAFALYGVFFIYAALGTVAYGPITAQVAGLPGINVQAAVGVSLFLLGIALRSGPGRFEALLPPIGAVYVAYRLDAAVRMIPRELLYVGAALMGLWAIANLAHAVGSAAGLFALSRQFKKISKEFFGDFLEGFFLRGLVEGPPWLIDRMSERLHRIASGLKGAIACALVFLAVGALIWWGVAP